MPSLAGAGLLTGTAAARTFANPHRFQRVTGTGLAVSGGTVCGAASEGGLYGSGTLYAVNTDGTGFTNPYTFSMARRAR